MGFVLLIVCVLVDLGLVNLLAGSRFKSWSPIFAFAGAVPAAYLVGGQIWGMKEQIEGLIVVVGPFLGIFGGEPLALRVGIILTVVSALCTLALGFGAGMYLSHRLKQSDLDDLHE